MTQGAEQEPRPRRRLAPGLGLALAILLACASTPPRDDAPAPTRGRGAPAPQRPASTEVYVVEPGESLAELARCSGVSLEALARDNGITNPNRIWAGEKLRLPASHRCTHSVALAGPSPVEARPSRVEARALLGKARARLEAADFEGALTQATACNAKLATEKDAKAKRLRAQCHVVAATAETGLDRRDRAIEEFRRALALDPDLELSSDEASPRVREVLAAARSTPAH